MCLSSNVPSEQMEKLIEHGMPKKIVKAVQYTMRKRAKEQEKKTNETSYSEIVTTVGSEAESFQEIPISPAPALPLLVAATPEIIKTRTALKVPLVVTSDTRITESARNEFKIPKMCGRFRQMQHDENAKAAGSIDNSHTEGHHGNGGKAYTDDALAVSTQLTKQFTQQLGAMMEKLQSTKLYTVLTTTTQPAHILAVCIFTFILFTIVPKLVDDSASGVPELGDGAKSRDNTLARIAYLGAFATHFGAQIWMTFVSGLSLYFSLPRHIFGQCQQILFPKYFSMNAALSISMLVLFVKYFLCSWTHANCVQVMALLLSATIEVTVRLYLAPPMLRLMHEKYKIERLCSGSGEEVGSLVQGDLAQCPHYQRIHKAFRRIHMTIATGNMTVMLATCVQLYFLASKIQIS